MPTFDRENALKLLNQWTESKGLRKHALGVETCMRWYASYFKEDEELWGNTGLLHDFDYEKYPEAPGHPLKGMEELRKLGWPEEMVEAIGGHAEYLEIPRSTRLAKTLYAVDELSGFIVAVALSRPNKKLDEVGVPAVEKKLRTSGFARAVSRDGIEEGAKELDIRLPEHISNCIAALSTIKEELGL